MDLLNKLGNYRKSKKSSSRKSSSRKSSSRKSKSRYSKRKSAKKSTKKSVNNTPKLIDFSERRNSNDLRRFMFPEDKNVNFKDLMMSNVSEYSIDKPEDAEYICKIMKF